LRRVYGGIAGLLPNPQGRAVCFYLDAKTFAGLGKAVNEQERVYLALFGGVTACRNARREHREVAAQGRAFQPFYSDALGLDELRPTTHIRNVFG
jgi:hypothetical protein